jgi:adenylate cyclase
MPAKPEDPSPSGSDYHNPSDDAIRQQLEKILVSPEFRSSPMLRDFLRFVVEKTLSGYANEIKGYTVATEVMGRKADFDADKDTIVRIQAGRLRRALERYYLTIGGQDPIRIDIPKGGYVPTFHPAAREAAGSEAATAVADEAVLIAPSGPSVAVMPLLDLTGDSKKEYFVEGLAEELTSELSRHQELRVIAHQSTQRWPGKGLDPRAVGQDLQVRFLVGGSIRKDAKTVKIDLYLVDTQTGLRIWGKQYCRELRDNNLIAVQEEIARQVVARIGSLYGIIPQTLSRESRQKSPESLEIYEAFLRFYHHVTILSPQTHAETLKVLEQTVRRAPESSFAWSLLALLYEQSYSLQLSPLASPLEKALVAARKAVALEPENQVTRVALAQVHFSGNKPELFLSEAEIVLALNPNAPFFTGYLGWLLALSGRWEQGLAILKKSLELNPHHPGWFHVALCFHAILEKDGTQAYQEAQQLQMPQFFWDPLLRAATLGCLGKRAEASQALAELLALKSDFPSQARFFISCYAKFPDLLEDLLDGLRLAGLEI